MQLSGQLSDHDVLGTFDVSEPPLRIELDLRGDQAIVNMVGELDMATAPLLRETVMKLLQPSLGVGVVILDLSELTFVDSTGLGVLAASRQRVEREGGALVLRGPRPNTVKVLAVTGLDRVFVIEP